MRRRVPVRAVAAAACAMAILVACSSAWATHNRATQLSWSAGAEAGEVHFTISFVARASYPPYESPEVGDKIIDPFLEFGDGGAVSPELLVTEIEGDTIYTIGQVDHTYAGSGPYTATIGSCCRLSASSGHVNNGDLSYEVHTLVGLAKADSSPSIAVAPVVFCATSGNCSFAFAGSGADPGNHLEWRLATPAETGDSFFVQPGPPFAPNAASVEALVGRVNWNTTGATLSAEGLPTYYSMQVVAEEVNASEETLSETASDFFIALDDDENEQPDCADTDSDEQVDDDADGLCDNWETEGIDSNHDGQADVFLPGADPNHKDMYVEIDYMKSRRPQASALQDVVNAFSAHDIALHFYVDEEIPFSENLAFGSGCAPSCPPGMVDFDEVKDAYFGAPGDRLSVNHEERLEALRFAYRYLLYANELQTSEGISGRAELPGNDATITLGSWRTAGGAGPPTQRNEAGTLMHELGHTLSLKHGGGDHVNCKPNYLSVMNYTRQTTGLLTAQLDYSDDTLPTLDESNLNEALGVQGPGGAQVVHGPGSYRVSSSTGPIDWNNSGSIESGVSADVNQISQKSACASASEGQHLASYDDWEHLALAFQATADFADGVHSTVVAQEPEIAASEVVDEDADGDGIPNIFDQCPTVAGSEANGGCPSQPQPQQRSSTSRSSSSSRTALPRLIAVAPARPLPNTKLKRARFRSGKRFAKFFFSAGGEVGLRYQCKLDRRKFRKCRSPVTLRRLRRGRHVFRVRAIDAAGQIEKRPAIRRFKTRRAVHRRARR